MSAGSAPVGADLWKHADPQSTSMFAFLQHVNRRHSLALGDYAQLHQWSVKCPAAFWAEVWQYVGITASRGYDVVLPDDAPMFPRPVFFAGARLNFAENMLFPPKASGLDPESTTAAVTATETGCRETTWAELRDMVRRCSASLRAAGLASGDVVAGFVSNHIEALAAMLAAASVGALWTSISPDNGVSAVLDRLRQVRPRVLFADDAMMYNGKTWPSSVKTLEIATALREHGLALVVVIAGDSAGVGPDLTGLRSLPDVRADDFAAFLAAAPPDAELRFDQLPADHPLYILYSSGTTGLPKAIVHTALGTLIQHKKELLLHCSMGRASRLFYYTTTSWMMWHWSISALALGATVVLYTGSPFKPHGYLSLPKLLSSLKVTHFGTSAAYLTTLEANKVLPVQHDDLDLSSLEAIYSTAAPLPPSTFAFVYEAFPSSVHLASITGGTDIVSLFGAPCPLLPVRAGEVQCAGLGMAVGVVDSAAPPDRPDPVSPGEPGDLVCTVPFPCQPLTFFGPDGEAKYRQAYFSRFPGPPAIWHHGDFVRAVAGSGGLVMLGRSDGVLKPAGVRFGSAEIYNILAKFFAAEVEDALCVGRRRPGDKDESVCLFVTMAQGCLFDDQLAARIRGVVRSELSPRHVPNFVDECKGGIPKTSNGKKIEVAVKQIISGVDIRNKLSQSVANPESLDWFKAWNEEHP
ncbi:acetoacetate-CoA ligase [Gaeumannomyces tritici R3-111a-1]|uniref:Acetoacetate-CoA ligase n=1 Tax=Gaeumannomyces tritici (strain R3-111a-1) TaxID=644352 RepID=J3NIC6_GAET3|nr:acetoacetate-CoA ligase [Gaeumannomyces tritici R3-111a-1]EJT81019.1 acetoacetate-CoA ligase [Gaeumannomyces tritici R3-111a-1]